MLAIKFKTEATPIAQNQRERLTPRGSLATMLDTITQRIADAMAALHDRAGTTLQLIGRQILEAIELLGETVGDVV